MSNHEQSLDKYSLWCRHGAYLDNRRTQEPTNVKSEQQQQLIRFNIKKKGVIVKKNPDHKYPKWLMWTLVVIGAIALFSFIGVPSTHQNSLSSSTTKVEAPQFTLTDIEGHSLALSQYRGKVVILDF
jgi:hypothetical protein